MLEQMGNAGVFNRQGSATFRLKLMEGPLELVWKHCDITADFLGKLHAARARELGGDVNEIWHNISYLVNEMLENAVKFGSSGDVELETGLGQGKLQLRICNSVERTAAVRFQNILDGLQAGDPSEMLIERIEENAANPNLSTSGLGLLTLMSDYGVEFGWKFNESDGSQSIKLETHASLPID